MQSEAAYVEEIRARVAGWLGHAPLSPGGQVEAVGAFPDTVIVITSSTRTGKFGIWDEDINDPASWEPAEFVAGEIARYYMAGYTE